MVRWVRHTDSNFIYGRGVNDLLVGGSGNNYIQPKADGDAPLSSIEVRDSSNSSSFDGNINADGSTYEGYDHASTPYYYGGGDEGPPVEGSLDAADWTFNYLYSGSRLGGSGVTPVAVYVTWNTANVTLSSGQQWTTNEVYTVYNDGVELGSVSVDPLSTPPTNESAVQPDRPWLRLGVWNVDANQTLYVTLTDASPVNGNVVCVGDAMIQAIWPTVTIRPTNVAVNTHVAGGNAGDYVDWSDAVNPLQLGTVASNTWTQLSLHASISQLYYSVPDISPGDWTTPGNWDFTLPEAPGLTFSSSADGTSQITLDENGNLIDAPLVDGSYSGNVWASQAVGGYNQNQQTPPNVTIQPGSCILAQVLGNNGSATSTVAVSPLKAGLDITPQLENGLDRMRDKFSYLDPEDIMLLATKLTQTPDAWYAWDIPTLISNAPEKNRICSIGAGIMPNQTTDATKYVVTVDGGAYLAVSVNYVLYGELMRLCHDAIRKMKAEVKANTSTLTWEEKNKLYDIKLTTLNYKAMAKNVVAYRKLKSQLDNAGYQSELDFAAMGYFSTKRLHWNFVSGDQVPGVTPNTGKVWWGDLEFRAGTYPIIIGDRDSGSPGIIHFRQGARYNDFADLDPKP